MSIPHPKTRNIFFFSTKSFFEYFMLHVKLVTGLNKNGFFCNKDRDRNL